MGEVLEVVDVESGRRLALKRPKAPEPPPGVSPSRRPRAPALTLDHLGNLLRREYMILAQLAHPNVVEVYEWGFDAGAPYYTMELLTGQHPGSPPLPWRNVCQMLMTLCEPLALLHSRRLVHRDITPRNVFVETDGVAKLIDFGAMASMGAHHRPIGTPSCMAPEVWRRDQLDGRADIYGLGALAYCALTGQHAYAARTLAQLPLLWQSLPVAPSELVPDTPRALDELILAMLSLDRDGRPRDVGEIMQRVSSLSGLPASRWVAPPAALAAPIVIGREPQLRSISSTVERARQGRGLLCVVRGDTGSGRTRLLEALSHAAGEAGMNVARASAGLLEDTPFALARELTQALAAGDLEQITPGLGAAELDEALALLRSDEAIGVPDEAETLALQTAFLRFCELKSSAKPLCLSVDDVERADVASTRALAQLSRGISNKCVLIAFAIGTDRPGPNTPLGLMFRHATWLETSPLDAVGIDTLARSVFGDVPNVTRLARWAYKHSEGHPGACMGLFEFLVSSGAAQLVTGRWELPEDPDVLNLPSHANEKLELALHGKRAGRALLDILSLVNRPFPLELSAYASILPGGQAATALDDLVRAQLVLATAQGYVMRDEGVLRWAETQLDAERSLELHRSLAASYAQHGNTHAIQTAYHAFRGGERERADMLARDLASSLENGLRDLIWRPGGLNAPPAFLEELLAYRIAQDDSPTNLYAVRGALIALALVSDVSMIRYAPETLDMLYREIGLDLWDQTDLDAPDRARLKACLGLARARREALPEAKRGLSPERAVVELMRCIAMLGSLCGFAYDVELARKLSTIAPRLRELSTDSRLIADAAEISFQSLVLGSRARTKRRALIAASHPDTARDAHPLVRDGIHNLHAYYLGLDLASDGSDEALQYADQLMAHPLYELLGLQLRRVHALGTGRYEEAQRWRRRRELFAVRTEQSDNHLRMAIGYEVHSAFYCWDLLDLSRCLRELEESARRYPGMQPWASLCRAYLQLRADEAAAASDGLETVLASVPPFSHGVWPHLMAALAYAKNELGEYARARELVNVTFEGARGLEIEDELVAGLQLRSAAIIATAGLGDTQGAQREIAALIASTEAALGANSVRVGLLREVACQVAWLARDYNTFSAQLDALGTNYGAHPGLRAQHARWVRKGKQRFRKLLVVLEKANAAKDWSSRIGEGFTTSAGEDGGQNLLAFILDELEVHAGQLYRVSSRGKAELLASQPDAEEPALLAAALRSLDNWFSSDESQTADEETEAAGMFDSQGRSYVPLWLMKPGRADEVAGLVLAHCTADQLGKLSPAFVKAIAVHLEAIGESTRA